MDNTIPPIRSDVVTVPSVARPTPTPVRVTFGEVLSKGAGTLVAGAQAAMEALPGGSLIAAAIRGGSTPSTTPSSPLMAGTSPNLTSTVAEGPGTVGTSVGGGFPTTSGTSSGTSSNVSTGSIDQSLQQSQEMNLYFLQIQQEVNAQNQTFSTLSNVMKTESDTIKNAISNLH
jgi:hypothetical protein